jgi:hypothetical protein
MGAQHTPTNFTMNDMFPLVLAGMDFGSDKGSSTLAVARLNEEKLSAFNAKFATTYGIRRSSSPLFTSCTIAAKAHIATLQTLVPANTTTAVAAGANSNNRVRPDDAHDSGLNPRESSVSGNEPSILDNGTDDRRCLDISFLKPLEFVERNLQKDSFFATFGELYIRDCMRTIFGLFGARNFGRTVLLGSNGVGTSILCFLAALYKAQSKPVVYYRQTASSLYTSVFIMCHNPNANGGVDIVFARKIECDVINARGGLIGLHLFVETLLNLEHREDVLWFVDGPKHDDRFMFQGYNFFCTSGGHPLFPDAEEEKQCWVLDGWTEEEATQALTRQGHDHKTIRRAYDLCGGNIRKMIAACSDYNRVRFKVEACINSAQISTVTTIAFTSTERGTGYFDQFFTMFRKINETGYDTDASMQNMWAYQYIDSCFVLRRFAERTDGKVLAEGFQYSKDAGHKSMENHFFVGFMHAYMKNQKT